MKKFRSFRAYFIAFLLAGAIPASIAWAWDEEGHCTVTRLAFEKLPADMPDWLKTPEVRARLEYLCNEPDRWRGQGNEILDHINFADHYLDAEDLTQYDLTLHNLPPFRRQFTDRLAMMRALHPEKFGARDPKKDPSYTSTVPGLLPWRIAELQWMLASSWTTLKTYEKYRDVVSDEDVKNARENIVYIMGIMSHYVGDGSQPLHLTKHHHGWVGENPQHYTTDHKGFHSFIDGGVIALHEITRDNLASRAKAPRKVTDKGYWNEIGDYLQETFEQVEPLYKLEKSGELRKAPGKKFIEDRLIEGGSMLSGVWIAGYQAGKIDEFREKRLIARRTDGHKPSPKPAHS